MARKTIEVDAISYELTCDMLEQERFLTGFLMTENEKFRRFLYKLGFTIESYRPPNPPLEAQLETLTHNQLCGYV